MSLRQDLAAAMAPAPRTPARIVQVIDGLGRGGAEQLLVAYSTELKRTGYDVQVVVLQVKDGNPQAERLQAAGIPVTLQRVDKLRRVDQLWSAVRAIRALKPDVVHAHLQFANIAAGLSRLALGVPAVATLHTIEHPSGMDRSSRRLWLMNRILATSVDRVICLSRASAEAARRNGLARARLEILGNGIDLSIFDRPPRQSRAELRDQFRIARDAPLIITVAVLRREKGVDRLVAAMPSLKSRCPDVQLLVVGDGPIFSALQSQVSALDLEDSIHLAGFRDDVPDLMRASDIFVLPTLGDALPTVVMEAMAARLPVVASDVGGLSDMVTQGVEGALVPPDDVPALAAAIDRLLLDADARSQAGEAARLRAERDFSLQEQVRRLAEIYEDLIARRRAVR
jgi:glycosyltransferase involved in cell wall biosynthesis